MEKKNISATREKQLFTIYDSENVYDDDNIPDVDLPKTTDISQNNVSRHNGPDNE